MDLYCTIESLPPCESHTLAIPPWANRRPEKVHRDGRWCLDLVILKIPQSRRPVDMSNWPSRMKGSLARATQMIVTSEAALSIKDRAFAG